MKTAYNPKTGSAIRGTAEHVPGVALGTFRRDADGGYTFEYDGGTDMFWDGQTTDTDETGERLFTDEDGEDTKESALLFLTDDEWTERFGEKAEGP